VSFDHGHVRLIIDATTQLPLELVTTRSIDDDPEWGVWGDVVTSTGFSSWSLEAGGVHLPRTRIVMRNGLPYERTSITDIDMHPAAPADSFAIADSSRAERIVPPEHRIAERAHDLGAGLVFVPDIWNVLIVKQDDGILIVDAPRSPAYSRGIIAEVGRRFPGVPIRGVVVSDFMYAHFGGIREYAARGIPIYAPATNVPLLTAVLHAPHRLSPDSLERARLTPRVVSVRMRMRVGRGANTVELIPAAGIGTDYGERIMTLYLPGRRILWASDLLPFPDYEPNFVTQGTSEVVAFIAREHLAVDSVLTTHDAPHAWRSPTAGSASSKTTSTDTVDAPVGSPVVDMHSWRPYSGRMAITVVKANKITPLFKAALRTVFRDSGGAPLMFMATQNRTDTGLLVLNRQTLAPVAIEQRGGTKMAVRIRDAMVDGRRWVDGKERTIRVRLKTPAFLGDAADLVVESLPRRTDVTYRVVLWQSNTDSIETHLYRTTGKADVRVRGVLYRRAWVVDDRLASNNALASRMWLIDKPPYMVRWIFFNQPAPGSEIRAEQDLAQSSR
jgi:hypothetical protein